MQLEECRHYRNRSLHDKPAVPEIENRITYLHPNAVAMMIREKHEKGNRQSILPSGYC